MLAREKLCFRIHDGVWGDVECLRMPIAMAVGRDGAIYVADSGSHRIMKWREGWQSGVCVAGGYRRRGEQQRRPRAGHVSDGEDSDTDVFRLCFPQGVTVAPSGAVYITENEERVSRWQAACQAAHASSGAIASQS